MLHTEAVYQAVPQTQIPSPYKLWPLTALVGKTTTFRLSILPGFRQLPDWGMDALQCVREDGLSTGDNPDIRFGWEDVPYHFEGNTLVFQLTLHSESEYLLSIRKEERNMMKFSIYALEEDYFTLNPYKGDFHQHSMASDGHQSPALSMIFARGRGMDFQALTDHQVYESSLTAINELKDSGTGMILFPGEEIHLPTRPEFIRTRKSGNPWDKVPWVVPCVSTHLINVGGTLSVNNYAYDDKERYFKEVAEYEKKIPETLCPEERFYAAMAFWAFDKVHQGNGIAIYPHPYWVLRDYRSGMDSMRELLMEKQPFDAFEAGNSCYADYNLAAQAEYTRQCALGRNPAVVGGSDIHNGVTAKDACYTILLAKDATLEGIRAALKSRLCCCVTPVSDRLSPILTGPFRLLCYVRFLIKAYFPQHDKLCALEGRLLEENYFSSSREYLPSIKATADKIRALIATR